MGAMEAWARGMGWWETIKDRQFAGSKDGYWCGASASRGRGKEGKFLYFLLPEDKRANAVEIAASLHRRKKLLGCRKVSSLNGWIEVYFPEFLPIGTQGKIARIDQALTLIVAQFREGGVGPSALCAKCGSKDHLEACCIALRLPLPLCPKCEEEVKLAAETAIRQYHTEEKHYRRGAAFILSLTLPNSVAAAALLAWNPAFACFIPVFLPILTLFSTLFGYKWSKAKWGPKTKWILLGSSLSNALVISILFFLFRHIIQPAPISDYRRQGTPVFNLVIYDFIFLFIGITAALSWDRTRRPPAVSKGRALVSSNPSGF